MLAYFKLPLYLWAEAINTACYTQNRSIINKRFNETPYELVYKRIPNISHFRTFGERCFILNEKEDRGKLKPKADDAYFLGYSTTAAAYRIYMKHAKCVTESVNVQFNIAPELALEQDSSGPVPNPIDPNQATFSKTPSSDLDALFEHFYYDYFGPSTHVPNPLEPPVLEVAETTDLSGPADSTNTVSTAATLSSSAQPDSSQRITEVSPLEPLEPSVQPNHDVPINSDSPQAIPLPEQATTTIPNPEPTSFPPPSTSTPKDVSSSTRPAEVLPFLESVQDQPVGTYVDDNPNLNQIEPLPHTRKWSRSHLPEQIIGYPSKPVTTRSPSANDCMFSSFLS